MSIGFGWKAKIGQLYPSGGQCDYEPQLMAPDGVQFLTTRLPFRQSRLEDDLNLVRDVESHARLCADAKVNLMLLNCTAASMVVGPEHINRRVEQATGVRSLTTIEAVVLAMRAARFRRVALMTPYLDEVVSAEVRYLSGLGVEVVAQAGYPCTNPIDQGSIAPLRWVELARTLREAPADGLLISCAGIQIGSVLQQIEQEFGRPVVASNQAAVWRCLRMLDIADRPAGFGDLLAGKFD